MSSPKTPQPRNRLLVTLDVVAGIALIFFGAVFALVSITLSTQFLGVAAACGTEVACSPTAINVAAYGLLAVTIFAFFLGVGLTIVRIIQKRLVFVWPLGALLLTVLALYVASFVVGQAVPA